MFAFKTMSMSHAGTASRDISATKELNDSVEAYRNVNGLDLSLFGNLSPIVRNLWSVTDQCIQRFPPMAEGPLPPIIPDLFSHSQPLQEDPPEKRPGTSEGSSGRRASGYVEADLSPPRPRGFGFWMVVGPPSHLRILRLQRHAMMEKNIPSPVATEFRES
jgi:hypothetical protein